MDSAVMTNSELKRMSLTSTINNLLRVTVNDALTGLTLHDFLMTNSCLLMDLNLLQFCSWFIFGQRQFLWFCFCTPTQWILNQEIKMWLECRFSALIRGVLHRYHSNCLGYILFLFTVPRFHRLKIHWTPGHDFNYKDSFLYLHEKPL